MEFNESDPGRDNRRFDALLGPGFFWNPALLQAIISRQFSQILQNGRTMLERLAHRGACACDNDSGDGAGVLTAIPDAFYRAELKR